MSTPEIAILIVFGLMVFCANLLASARALRCLGRYSFRYLCFIWLAPIVGAMFVLAKISPRRRPAFAPNTMAFGNPVTIRVDPWPTLSHVTHTPHPFRK